MGLVDRDLAGVDELQQSREHLGTDVRVLLDPDQFQTRSRSNSLDQNLSLIDRFSSEISHTQAG